jgi:hypothetical protein
VARKRGLDLRALTHHDIAGPKHDRSGLRRVALDRHEAHGRALDGFTNRLGVSGVVLLPLYKRLDIGRWDQLHVMAEHDQNASSPLVFARPHGKPNALRRRGIHTQRNACSRSEL